MNEPTPPENPAPPPPTFDVIPLSADIRQAVDALGYTNPTPVQVAVFEPAVRGKSLVVQARTGTGKTAAFGLPILDQLVRKSISGVQALILTPTRELALQVANELENLGRFRGIKVLPIYGGAPMGKQIEGLAAGAQIVAGTPGRVLDHLRRGTFDPSNVRIFVLDEADEMLSMGFAKELHAIIEHLPKERQGLFFSATIPPDIERLARSQLKDPEFLTLSSDQVGALQVQHYVYIMRGGDKRQELVRIIEIEDPESAVVFCNTKDETERVAEALQNKGYDADWLNGDLEQRERERIMARTREGKLRFLVATDVAARGIDISHLTHVINADFPETAEYYVHRTGRTGRAGRTGTAISLVGPKDIGSLYLLRLTYKIRPIERQLPTAGELKTRQEADLVGMFQDAFAGRVVHPDDLALARRLFTLPDSEKIVAGLLRDHLGARQTDPATEAAEARRAKNPPPIAAAIVPPSPQVEARVTLTSSVAPPTVKDRPRDRPRERERPPARLGPPSTRPTGERQQRDTVRDTPIARADRPPPELRARAPRPAEPGGTPRGRVPHSTYVTWEPPTEVDDDTPILDEAERARSSRGGAPSTPRTEEPKFESAPTIVAPPPDGMLAAPRERSPRRAPPAAIDATNGVEPEDPDFAQIFVNVGRRDGARPGDFQRLLEQGAGLDKKDTGPIRVRERNTFVSVRKEALDKAVAALAGQVIGGRSVIAEPARRVGRDAAG
jgi:ATP-dependent RNA helicase DeaD